MGVPSLVTAPMIFWSSQNLVWAAMPFTSLQVSPASSSPFWLVISRPTAFGSPKRSRQLGGSTTLAACDPAGMFT